MPVLLVYNAYVYSTTVVFLLFLIIQVMNKKRKQKITQSGQLTPSGRSRISPCSRRLMVKGDERSGASQEPLTMSVSRVGFGRTDGGMARIRGV